MGIVLILVVAGILYVLLDSGKLRGAGHQEARVACQETPLETLQKRYARGEIDRADYEGRRRDLG